LELQSIRKTDRVSHFSEGSGHTWSRRKDTT
jgi:hypothetical protein